MRLNCHMRKKLIALVFALTVFSAAPAYADGPGNWPAETSADAVAETTAAWEEAAAAAETVPAETVPQTVPETVPQTVPDTEGQVPDYVPRNKIPSGRYLYIPRGQETATDGVSVFRSLNDPHHGNEGFMRNYHSQGNPYNTDWEAVQAAMDAFLVKYNIGGYTTGFTKELAIIRGLMQECSYAEATDLSCYTAYNCLVEHRAQCAGYADAFLQLVRYAMPGTDVRYIHSDWHAWNLICLDGDWYHVDVTWEDDDETNEIRNYFVNLEDDLIEAAGYHHWVREDSGTPAVSAAEGYRYGPMSVELYRVSGGAWVEAEPAPITISAGSTGGVISAEEVFQQALMAVSGAMAGRQRIIRLFIPGLNHAGSSASIRGMMQEVTNTLHRQMLYVSRPWYEFTGSTVRYRVSMTGTMIEIILPDQPF